MLSAESAEEYAEHVESIQGHYYWLDLSFAQAEEVLRFERLKGIRSDEDFTKWEELAFEADTFERILTPEQLALYQQMHLEEVISYEEMLRAQDAAAAPEIEELRQRLAYFRQQLIPALYREEQLLPLVIGPGPKIDFILAEYQQYWEEEKQRLVVRHYRHYRRYCPQLLEAQMLRHELMGVWPDYRGFTAQVDAPTKVVLEFVLSDLRSWVQQLRPKRLSHHETALQQFGQQLFQARYGVSSPQQLPGWHFTVPANENDELDEWALVLLWLGRDVEVLRRARGGQW